MLCTFSHFLLVHQNALMRCIPVALFSVQYISHNREFIEGNEEFIEEILLILQKTENGNGFKK